MMPLRPRALLFEDRPGSLSDVAHALAQQLCDVEVAPTEAGIAAHNPATVDLVVLEMDLPPVRGLHLINTMKQDPRWRWVFTVVIYCHEPCDEEMFAVWLTGRDIETCDTPEESRVAWLLETLPYYLAQLPDRAERATWE
jgi:response regulator RpfG family c-di-GMP phosphodiesterase